MATKQPLRRLAFPVVSDRAWWDPELLLRGSEVTATDIEIAPGSNVQLAPADPKRYMIGFMFPSSAAGATVISPFGDPDVFGLAIVEAFRPQWFTLFGHGPIVMQQWFARAGVLDFTRVVQVTRKRS